MARASEESEPLIDALHSARGGQRQLQMVEGSSEGGNGPALKRGERGPVGGGASGSPCSRALAARDPSEASSERPAGSRAFSFLLAFTVVVVGGACAYALLNQGRETGLGLRKAVGRGAAGFARRAVVMMNNTVGTQSWVHADIFRALPGEDLFSGSSTTIPVAWTEEGNPFSLSTPYISNHNRSSRESANTTMVTAARSSSSDPHAPEPHAPEPQAPETQAPETQP